MKIDKVRIMCFGDIALNTPPNRNLERNDYSIFGDVAQLFKQADLVIGNLESPLPGNGGENLLKKPRVIANPDAFEHLAVINPTILCLANNHMYDALEAGYENTINFLKENNISYLGAGYSNEETSEPIIMKKNGVRIGLLNYVTRDTNPNLPENRKFELNFFDLDKAVQDLKDLASKTDIRIVSLHWGVEYHRYATPEQNRIARLLSQNGADLIVGHHAHVIHPIHKYKDTLIAYNLGNFYFPNIWFENRWHREWSKKSRESIILDVIFSKSGVDKFNYHRTVMKESSVVIHSGNIGLRMKIIQFINILLRCGILWKIYYSTHRFIEKGLDYLRAKTSKREI